MKVTCTHCNCTFEHIKPVKVKSGSYSSQQLESGSHMWTTPQGKQFVASFPVDKTILALHKKKLKMSEYYQTEWRNARLGYTFDDVTQSLPGIRTKTPKPANIWEDYLNTLKSETLNIHA